MRIYFLTMTVCCLWLMAAGGRISAQVLDLSQYRQIVYQQTNASSLVTLRQPDDYYFFSVLDADPDKALEYSPFMVYTPSTANEEFVMAEEGTYYFAFYGQSYSNKTDLDTNYPPGGYDYVTTYSDPNDGTPRSDNVIVFAPTNELYSATLPAFTTNCWTAMQHVDPSVDFPLSWNSYGLAPGATYAITFVNAYDSQTLDSTTYGGYYYYGDPGITSTVIPAGSLDYGRTYIVELFFSTRVTSTTTNSDGSAVALTFGYDDVTDATLTTKAPPLQIAPAGNQSVTLSWPAAATNYVLQTTSDLNCADCWAEVPDSPDVNGTTNQLTLPIENARAFFRLAPVGP
jgi:hypothetical protein